MREARPPFARRLVAIKLVHTVAWAFFASCIIALPIAVWQRRLALAALLVAIVFVEVLVIAFNRWQCPLTPLAARYTDDRADNFDIYLPAWLARHNKLVFGALYFAGVAYAVLAWRGILD